MPFAVRYEIVFSVDRFRFVRVRFRQRSITIRRSVLILDDTLHSDVLIVVVYVVAFDRSFEIFVTVLIYKSVIKLDSRYRSAYRYSEFRETPVVRVYVIRSPRFRHRSSLEVYSVYRFASFRYVYVRYVFRVHLFNFIRYNIVKQVSAIITLRNYRHFSRKRLHCKRKRAFVRYFFVCVPVLDEVRLTSFAMIVQCSSRSIIRRCYFPYFRISMRMSVNDFNVRYYQFALEVVYLEQDILHVGFLVVKFNVVPFSVVIEEFIPIAVISRFVGIVSVAVLILKETLHVVSFIRRSQRQATFVVFEIY